MEWEDVARRYDYDPDFNRMLDTWWPTDDPSAAVTQSLRCYAPDELHRLLESTGSALTDVHPGGAHDHNAGIYRRRVPLEEVMQYVATLELSARNPRWTQNRSVFVSIDSGGSFTR